ncbi:hypothetical protein F4694_003389 [Bacillus niacini]|uniref:Uncharacterized protein n=1 Tax=Neobacillus niacini TaxID=86668 RepID=A0A852TEW9_9BACI|nr:hypothetical protein [Neobacillus niacini]
MIVTFYFFISWVLIGLFLFNRIHRHASVKEVTLLFLLCCLINTNTYIGLFDTFKWMKTTTDTDLYIATLIFKNVFVPLLMCCFTLLIYRSPWNKKIQFFSLFSFITVSSDLINEYKGMYTFKQWNIFYTFLYFSIFLLVLLLTLKWYRGLDPCSRGEKNVVD